jgi:threonine-phosphate decarboxylase
MPEHGGNLDALTARRTASAQPLLDFSANVNPLGPPDSVLAALRELAGDRDNVMRYPEPSYRALREAIGHAHGVAPEAIVIANGSAALLEAAIAALGVRRALVPTPAFSEYRRALASRGAEFVAAPLPRDRDFAIDPVSLAGRARAVDADTLILNTPHNPSGSWLPADATRALCDTLGRDSRATIVDEAFVDYLDGESTIAYAARTPRVVAVRSLTKFFAVPALRVGFAVAHSELASAMRAYLPSWSVTSIAARAIVPALRDEVYAERTRAANVVARRALKDALGSIGVRTLPSVANYLLAELPQTIDARTFTTRAIDAFGIVVRDCTSYDGLEDGRFVRVAVRSPDDNRRLVDAFATICGVLPQANLGKRSSAG